MYFTGSGGVGYLLCKTLAGLGAKVAILDINRPSSFDADAHNGRLRFYQCDVSDYGQVQAAVKTINQDFGMQPVTILVNNAGIVKGLSIGELSESDIRKVYGVNTLSGYWTVKSILPQMQESRYGHIVTVSSTMGITAVAEMSDYCGSKFAACGFHEALRQELNGLPYKHRIQTTLVCPGLILTGMFSGIKINVPFLTPPLKPEHVVEKIVHALHRQVETDGFLSLTQKHKVIWTPSSYYFIAALGLLTPVWVCDFVKEVLGANRALGNLHSKSKK